MKTKKKRQFKQKLNYGSFYTYKRLILMFEVFTTITKDIILMFEFS